MLNTDTHTSVANIMVKSIYSPKDRAYIAHELIAIRKHLHVGMTRFNAEILVTVAANNQRIVKPDGSTGLYVEQLSVKNTYHFFDGVRSDDARVQILDAYLQITNETRAAQ